MRDDAAWGAIVLTFDDDGVVSATQVSEWSEISTELIMIADPRYVRQDGDRITILDWLVYQVHGYEGIWAQAELVEVLGDSIGEEGL